MTGALVACVLLAGVIIIIGIVITVIGVNYRIQKYKSERED